MLEEAERQAELHVIQAARLELEAMQREVRGAAVTHSAVREVAEMESHRAEDSSGGNSLGAAGGLGYELQHNVAADPIAVQVERGCQAEHEAQRSVRAADAVSASTERATEQGQRATDLAGPVPPGAGEAGAILARLERGRARFSQQRATAARREASAWAECEAAESHAVYAATAAAETPVVAPAPTATNAATAASAPSMALLLHPPQGPTTASPLACSGNDAATQQTHRPPAICSDRAAGGNAAPSEGSSEAGAMPPTPARERSGIRIRLYQAGSEWESNPALPGFVLGGTRRQSSALERVRAEDGVPCGSGGVISQAELRAIQSAVEEANARASEAETRATDAQRAVELMRSALLLKSEEVEALRRSVEAAPRKLSCSEVIGSASPVGSAQSADDLRAESLAARVRQLEGQLEASDRRVRHGEELVAKMRAFLASGGGNDGRE